MKNKQVPAHYEVAKILADNFTPEKYDDSDFEWCAYQLVQAGYRKQIEREAEHGKWHIMPEDPYDESGCPTEEGWYRIITADGEESTDYYFNKPTMTGNGVVYWRDSKKVIRAWAKMKGEKQ